MRFDPARGSHEARSQDISLLSWEEPGVYGLDSHVEILNIKLFLVTEKLGEDIILILLFFIDLFTIFELITILSINYGNHIISDSQWRHLDNLIFAKS